MNTLTAFWNIFVKDMRTYYLKPPNVSWGIIFPLAWTGMFFIRSGSGLESIPALLPGLVAISILFGTTSMLSVTVTFEKKNRSFERLLLAPISLNVLMLAKTGGAIVFGVINAFIPVIMAVFLPMSPGFSGPFSRRRFLHCRGVHFPGTVHRRLRQRGLRGPDVLKLFPVSHDLPVRSFLPDQQAPVAPQADLLLSSPDLRGQICSTAP